MARGEPGSSVACRRLSRATLCGAGGVLLGLSCLAAFAMTVLGRSPPAVTAPASRAAAEGVTQAGLPPGSGGAHPEMHSSPAAALEAAAGEEARPDLADTLVALWSDPEGLEVGRELLLTSSLDTRRLLLAALREHTALYQMEEDERLDLAADLITLHFETTDVKFREDVRAAVAELAGEEVARELEPRNTETETETDTESESESESETEMETDPGVDTGAETGDGEEAE